MAKRWCIILYSISILSLLHLSERIPAKISKHVRKLSNDEYLFNTNLVDLPCTDSNYSLDVLLGMWLLNSGRII